MKKKKLIPIKKNLKLKTKTVKKKSQKRLSVINPKHRISPKGISISWDSTSKICIKSCVTSEITENQQKAFLKALKSKTIRRLFRFRGIPFVELTKKPAEVRMERTWYKIYKRILH